MTGFGHSGFFALRTPLLPFDEILAWGEGDDLLAHLEDEGFEARYEARRQQLRERLQEACRRPEVREALFLASPSLDQSYETWEKDPDSEKGRRVGRTVVKYFQRMAGRSTPFGLFAGGSVGTIGTGTHLQLPPRSAYRRHTRLDMDYVTSLVDTLARSEELREEIRLRPNSSLYRRGGKLCYAEARHRGRTRSYFLVVVEADEYLLATLGRAERGETLRGLARALVDEDIDEEDGAAYVNRLVDVQILVPELAPAVTGPETLPDVIDQLRGLKGVGEVRDALRTARDGLREMDEAGLGVPPRRYREMASSLERLPADAEIARLFQVDMMKPGEDLQLGADLVEELEGGLRVLHDLFGTKAPDSFESFRGAFRSRYGDREVPLLEVLDEEVGIGFAASENPQADAAPLLAGLPFPGRGSDDRVRWDARMAFLHRKLADALASGAEEIVIDPSEVEAYRVPERGEPPEAFQVMASLLAERPELPEAPRWVLHGLAGPSGARLLGRFCHGDLRLREHVRRHLADEEALHPDVAYFEIVHLPEGRIGNVLARPLLRTYELAYLGRSGAPPEATLSAGDLTIRLEGDRIVLRSRKLGKEVRPRLTTAHNFSYRAVGLYRFLATLQTQNALPALSWTWGVLGGGARIPRVRSGHVVLERAAWNVEGKELEFGREDSGAERFRRTVAWRHGRKLPRFVGLADGDNVLPVDLENPLSVEAFLDVVKKRSAFALTEMLPGPDELAVDGPEGPFCNEILVPFVRKAEAAKPPGNGGPPAAARPARNFPGPRSSTLARAFPPGSEWLYVKLYSGAATSDEILQRVVRPVALRARESGAAESWFFIRYSDPEYHLRVRFRGDRNRLVAETLPALRDGARVLLDDGRLWRIQLDTYQRETSRYGGEQGIELCEELFHVDSRAAVDVLGTLQGDEGAALRWCLTLAGLDRLLADCDFDLQFKYALMTGIAESFAKEFGIEGEARKQVLARYRRERKTVEGILGREKPAPEAEPALHVLERRSREQQPLLAALRERSEEGRLGLPFHSIVASLLHMHANRMVRSSARAHEMVLYRFLEVYYDSMLARMGMKKRDRPSLEDQLEAVVAVSGAR